MRGTESAMARKDEFRKKLEARALGIIIGALLVFLVAVAVQGHGGKSHGADDFTAFQALQKATELYERLLESGKLDQSWETGLVKAGISSRVKKEMKEVVVSFHRSSGEPDAVYIFFTNKGKYAGSNFTGE